MKKWMLRRRSADFNGFSAQFNIDPLLAMILVNNDIATGEEMADYLGIGEPVFHDPFLLKDMEMAVSILKDKIKMGKKIRIIGDYDVDGVCSAAILYKGLRSIGANVDTVIPHRIHDGYGLNINIIEKALSDEVDTILTCDNGIAAFNEIEKAVENGMTVIVTDHHEVPFLEDENGEKCFIMPPAAAVVDPKREDCEYPFKAICGAYVSFKLVQALTGEKDTPLINELTQLAALATVADIMVLKGENRNLVKKGLKLMSNTENEGLKALLAVKELYGKPLTSYHMGFVIGPCINAAGRLSSADRALELLLADDRGEAQRLAADLSTLNDSRKKITEDAVKSAVALIGENIPSVIVMFLEDCHESVAGIVAGKLREMYSRPALVICKGENCAKGSGRSIEKYNMYEELSRVKDIFIKFGGHSQAAGFSLPIDKIDELRQRLNDNCNLSGDDFKDVIYIDAAPPLSYISPSFVDQLELMQPLGAGNEGCRLARKDVKLIGARFIGSQGDIGKFKVKDSDGYVCEMIMFRNTNAFLDELRIKYGTERVDNAIAGRDGLLFSVCYTPNWNEFNGRKSIQYVIEDCVV